MVDFLISTFYLTVSLRGLVRTLRRGRDMDEYWVSKIYRFYQIFSLKMFYLMGSDGMGWDRMGRGGARGEGRGTGCDEIG